MSDERGRLGAQSPGLPYWRDAIVGRDTMDRAAMNALVTHPRFAEACLRSVNASLALHDTHPKIVHMIQDVGRAFYAVFVLYLSARGDLTLTAIRDFCKELGLLSPGRAAAILVHLRMIGFVVPHPVQVDRRTRRYLPSEATQTLIRDVFRNELRAFSLIEPEALRVADRVDDLNVFRAIVLMLGLGMSNVVRQKQSSAFSHFDSRNSGQAILFRIVSSGQEGDVYPPRLPVHVSVNGLAEKFKVSRSHVLKLLRDAEKLGLVRRDAEAMTVALLEPLRAAILEYHAALYMGYASAACAALEALGETP